MERRSELMAAAASRFGLLERNRLQTHFSEHSLVRSYRRDEKIVYVRLTDESHKPYAKIAGEVQWVEYLGSKGVCVSRPLHSAAGNLAERIRMEDREYTAVCYEEAKGRPVGENEAGEDLYRRMGRFMGACIVSPKRISIRTPPQDGRIGRMRQRRFDISIFRRPRRELPFVIKPCASIYRSSLFLGRLTD